MDRRPQSFDCFISYSRGDSKFAEQLHAALSRYKPPKGIGEHRRPLRTFFDTRDITGTEYYDAIERHLAGAGKLLLICSPDAAKSQYVDDEVERFIRLHGSEQIVPILAKGIPNNEATSDQVDEIAFPPALTRALAMPLAVDFRNYDPSAARIDADAYRSSWIMLLANVLGVSRAEIEQREAMRRRARRRTWLAVTSAAFTVLLSLTLWALYEGERALARQLTAQAAIPGALVTGDVERRVIIAREAALRQSRLRQQTRDADMALRNALNRLPRKVLFLPAASRAVTFSGDGRFLISAESAELIVYSLEHSAAVGRVALPQPLRQVRASADLRHLAALDKRGRLQLWTWPELRAIPAIPHEVTEAPVNCIAFNGSGEALVAMRILADGHAFELLYWNTGERQLRERATAKSPGGRFQPLNDGRCLIGHKGKSAGRLRQVALQSGDADQFTAWYWPMTRPEFSLSGKEEPLPIRQWASVDDIALSHDASPVLLLNNGQIQRPMQAAEQSATARNHRGAMSLSRDGNWVASMTTETDPYVPLLTSTRINFIDTATGIVARTVGDFARQGEFTPDAETFVTFANTRIRLWDRRSGEERLRLTAGFSVAQLEFDQFSRYLVAHANDGALEVFDIGAADELLRVAPGVKVSMLAGGQTVLATEDRLLVELPDSVGLPAIFKVDGYLYSVESAPGGRFLVVGAADKKPVIMIGEPPGLEIMLVEQGDGETMLRYRGQWGTYRFDAASTRLLVAGSDGKVRMIDTSDGNVLWTRNVGSMRPPPAAGLTGWRPPLAFAKNGSVAVVPTSSGIVMLDGRDGRVLGQESIRPTALALNANGDVLARNGNDNSIVVQRVGDGTVVARLDATDVVDLRDLMLSPNGKLLLGIGGTAFSTFMSGGHYTEEHAVLWDVEHGRRLTFIPASTVAFRDYGDQIRSGGDEAELLTSMIWNAYTGEFAGRMFASLLTYWTVPEQDVGTVLVAWRLTNEGVQETYRAATNEPLTPAALSSTPGSLIVKNIVGQSRMIRFIHDHLIEVGCAAVPREMTREEQRQALSGWRTPMACPSK